MQLWADHAWLNFMVLVIFQFRIMEKECLMMTSQICLDEVCPIQLPFSSIFIFPTLSFSLLSDRKSNPFEMTWFFLITLSIVKMQFSYSFQHGLMPLCGCSCSSLGDKIWFETNPWKIWTWCKDGKLILFIIGTSSATSHWSLTGNHVWVIKIP